MVQHWYDVTLYMICFHALWNNHVCMYGSWNSTALCPHSAAEAISLACGSKTFDNCADNLCFVLLFLTGLICLNYPHFQIHALYCHVWLNYIHNKWGLCTIYVLQEKKKLLFKQISVFQCIDETPFSLTSV